MPRQTSLDRTVNALRDHALSYPETREEFPWGERALKVKGKVFLFMSLIDQILRLSLKLPLSSRAALLFPFASPTGYGLGKSGWVTARFTAEDDIPVEMLMEWVDESFRAVAPKKVVAILEHSEGDVDPSSQGGGSRSRPKRARRRRRS